ncbi:hypothetical protein, partial [Endozoicomonas sp. SESOKO2]|uniref:hypothetical protein n=1 Tax=Endozoicomonas sp. SESOKO2 TaxID=2828743 RepID=UPI002147B795
LFATINPPEYSGRKALSPALKGRFRHLPIRQYNPTELETIAGKVLPESSEGEFVAKKLTEKHCHLRAYLQRKNLPLQPTSLDLQNVARAVFRGGDFTEKALHQCLNQYYRLYLMAAKISLEALPESSTFVAGNSAIDYELYEWFNQTVSGIDRPWLIRGSYFNSIDEKRHEIRIKADLNGEEAKTEIIKRVAQARWQASGLSLKPDESDDILTQALYRHWQRRWFDCNFGQTGVDAGSVFSLTAEQEQTLKLPASQPYLREADQRISAWDSKAVRLWPAFWRQMSGLQNNHRVESYVKKVLATDGNKAPEQYIPEFHREQDEKLDWRTNYSSQERLNLDAYKIFDTQNYTPDMYRCWATDIDVSDEGDVIRIDLNDQHILGVETLIPLGLPVQDQKVTLTRDQTLATLETSSKNGQYVLPSLTPDDYIVALRMEPDLAFTLVRDRYTGLHTLTIPEAVANQIIRVTYVVEPREPGKKTSANGASPERSRLLDARCSKGMKTVLDKLFKTVDQVDQVDQPLSEEQMLLQTIKNAKGTNQRIEAITDYCKQFSGEKQPERNKNFFEFLVTERQGSCRHRVPVFIAFCR